MLDCKCSFNFDLYSFLYSIDLVTTACCLYSSRYMIFVWFWTSQFIVAVGQLAVAVAVSKWYFSRNRRNVGNSTFMKSIFVVLVYHLGTAAFGALIIAMIKTIRAILSYIQKKATKSKLRLAVVLLKVLKCLVWCLEKCVSTPLLCTHSFRRDVSLNNIHFYCSAFVPMKLKFINKQAYIQTGRMRSYIAHQIHYFYFNCFIA